MTFGYQPRPIQPTPLVDGTTVYRPLVPVYLATDQDMLFVWALADTGADQTLLPASVANELGISFDKDAGTVVQGYGGQSLTVAPYELDLILSYGNHRWQWTARVGFVFFDQPDHEVTVLGHHGFFQYFAVTFDGSARELSLIPTPAFPGTASHN